ncbi:universal stress protein [Oceanimonas sp. NS1]|nr:universal stress protein [Oceanimonas sp. NS1]
MSHFIPADDQGRISTRILSGEVKKAITSVVHDSSAQLLVLGYHGRQGISRLLIGNLAELSQRASLRCAGGPVTRKLIDS